MFGAANSVASARRGRSHLQKWIGIDGGRKKLRDRFACRLRAADGARQHRDDNTGCDKNNESVPSGFISSIDPSAFPGEIAGDLTGPRAGANGQAARGSCGHAASHGHGHARRLRGRFEAVAPQKIFGSEGARFFPQALLAKTPHARFDARLKLLNTSRRFYLLKSTLGTCFAASLALK